MPVVVVVSFQTRSPKRSYLAHHWSQRHCTECQDVDSTHKMEGKRYKRIIPGTSWYLISIQTSLKSTGTVTCETMGYII
jgi:hypothetical protein